MCLLVQCLSNRLNGRITRDAMSQDGSCDQWGGQECVPAMGVRGGEECVPVIGVRGGEECVPAMGAGVCPSDGGEGCDQWGGQEYVPVMG
jgi:hypothetical protein